MNPIQRIVWHSTGTDKLLDLNLDLLAKDTQRLSFFQFIQANIAMKIQIKP